MIHRQERVGLTATERRHQIQHRLPTRAGHALHGLFQQVTQTPRQVCAAKELGRVAILRGRDALMNLPQIGGELRQLERAPSNIIVGLHNVPPRRQASRVHLHRQRLLTGTLQPLLVLLEHDPAILPPHLIRLVRLGSRTNRPEQVLPVHEYALSPLRTDAFPVRPLLPRIPQSRRRTLVLKRQVIPEDRMPLLVEHPEQVRRVRHVRSGIPTREPGRTTHLRSPIAPVLHVQEFDHPRAKPISHKIEHPPDAFLVRQPSHDQNSPSIVAALSPLNLTSSAHELIRALYRS